jgi:hypothetical protein
MKNFVLITWAADNYISINDARETIYRRVDGNLFTPMYFRTIRNADYWERFEPCLDWPNNHFPLTELEGKWKIADKRWLTEDDLFLLCL